MTLSVRPPAVAGLFYPEDAGELKCTVNDFLHSAITHPDYIPKAIIAPHAGYIYSGALAGAAYNGIEKARDVITRVVVLGPSHRVPLRGIASSSASYFATPLGNVPLDSESIHQLIQAGLISIVDQAHAQEHSLEVQLPFLQLALDKFSLLPLVVGEVSLTEVSQLLEAVWGGPETLVVISSDLSHFHDYATCQAIDETTSKAIESLQPEHISYEQACGRNPINGLLTLAKQKGLQVERVGLCNSGDTAGTKDRVVGYGAYWLH